jgi:hypothetical protein
MAGEDMRDEEVHNLCSTCFNNKIIYAFSHTLYLVIPEDAQN